MQDFKICYLIAAHEEPTILREFIKHACSNYIVIHIDASTDRLKFIKDLGQLPPTCFIISESKSIHVNWAGFSQVKVQLELARTCRTIFNDATHLVFLHGTCFPVRPLIEFEQFIHSQKDENGLAIQALREDRFFGSLLKRRYLGANKVKWKAFRDSFSSQIIKNSTTLNKMRKLLIRGLELLPIPNPKYDKKRNYFFGSALFFIKSDVADFMLSKESEIADSFQYCFASDEMAFHTFFAESTYCNLGTYRYLYTNSFAHESLLNPSFLFVPSGFNRKMGIQDLDAIDKSGKYFLKKPDPHLLQYLSKRILITANNE